MGLPVWEVWLLVALGSGLAALLSLLAPGHAAPCWPCGALAPFMYSVAECSHPCRWLLGNLGPEGRSLCQDTEEANHPPDPDLINIMPEPRACMPCYCLALDCPCD